MLRKHSSDHAWASVARFVAGAAGVVAALMIIRSLPDFVRYVKMERM